MTSQKPRSLRADEQDAGTPPVPGEVQSQTERIGDVLRRERERRGDDLHRIADHLCIKASFLTALENNDYDAFPADAYVIGFLRSYAVYLGFDGKEAIDRYRLEMAGRRRKPALAMPAAVSEGRAPSALVIAGALVAAFLIYALWYGLSSSDRTAVSQPPALPTAPAPEPPHTDAVPAPAPDADASATAMPPAQPTPPATADAPEVAPPPPTPAPAAIVEAPTPPPTAPAPQARKPAPGSAHMQVRALQPSWILIKDSSGTTVVDRVMKAGEVYNVPDQKGLSLTTGNGSGVVLMLDGRDLPKLSTDSAHIVRDIPLDAGHLKTLPSQE